jgi:hypothetical protein
LDSGRIQFGAPNTRSTDAIYYLDPTSIEDLQSAFNQEKKRLPKPGEPSRFDVYTEWRDHILAEPKKHHFPKLISGKDKKGDPTVRIDRSCPMNQGNVCYDLDAYSRAIANFKYNNSKFMLKQELGSPARVDTATNPEWNGSSLASQALTSARETVISKIEGKAWGVIKSDGNAAVIDQPQQRSPAQAVSSAARTVKLPRTYKHDVHLTVSDEYMRSLIDSIQF